MTACRQQALACAASVAAGPRRTREIRSVVNASSILLRNVYGWFTRIKRGVYALTPQGTSALALAPTGCARGNVVAAQFAERIEPLEQKQLF